MKKCMIQSDKWLNICTKIVLPVNNILSQISETLQVKSVNWKNKKKNIFAKFFIVFGYNEKFKITQFK